jgi:hypothetical protein
LLFEKENFISLILRFLEEDNRFNEFFVSKVGLDQNGVRQNIQHPSRKYTKSTMKFNLQDK